MPDQGVFSIDIPETISLRIDPLVRKAAAARGMEVDEWIQALLAAHVERCPTWNPHELDELQAMTSQTRQMMILIRSGDLASDVAVEQLTLMYELFVRRLNEMTDRQRDYWLPAA